MYLWPKWIVRTATDREDAGSNPARYITKEVYVLFLTDFLIYCPFLSFYPIGRMATAKTPKIFRSGV